MQAENKHKFPKIQELVKTLHNDENNRKSLNIGLELANEILAVLGANRDDLLYGDNALDKAFSNAKFKNQKMETWFKKHPYFKSGRVALNLYDQSDAVYESNFYWLNDSATKARVSSTVMLNPNWEDSELTMLPSYKIGIDFFLNNTTDTLSIVISKNGNLRVLELSEKLSNTQIEIFDNVRNCLQFDGIDPKTGKVAEKEPQQTIHRKLWDAFELKEVNKKFYIGIADHFERLCQHLEKDADIKKIPYINEKRIQNFSNRLIGRLLFLWFLRKRNIIDESQEYFVIGEQNSSKYYETKLKPLFFETLNKSVEKRTTKDKKTPYLNGGLFEAHEDDFFETEIFFPEDWFYTLYKHLDGFNFTTDESTPEYQQVAIDPEMLGRVFENLLASIRPETSGAANERKNKGAFYTPREIVDFMCKESLKEYIKSKLENEKDFYGVDRLIDMNDSDFLEQKSTGVSELWGNRSSLVKEKIINLLNEIKILDPACGSGAFPIGMLQLTVKTLERLTAIYDKDLKKHRLIKQNEKIDLYSTKLAIIHNSLYGIDIEPMAIEIARLRSWLSLIIDEGKSINPLPNLDFNFVCANSLLPLKKVYQMNMFEDQTYEKELKDIRDKYFNAHSTEGKLKLKDEFSHIYIKELDSNQTEKAKQLKSWNPFESSKPAIFFDAKIMFNMHTFDVLIGNPPYIHFEDIKENSKNLYKPLSYKTYEARGDIYTLFYEMGVNNLKENGVLCYITSNKWMRANYGEKLRDYFLDYTNPLKLIDLGSNVFENATVDTSILLLSKSKNVNRTLNVELNFKSDEGNLSNYVGNHAVFNHYKKRQPWVILNDIEQSIKYKIEKIGKPLSEWSDVKINRGVLTGLNEAYVINEYQKREILRKCKTDKERNITKQIIKPVLLGKDMKIMSYNWSEKYIILLPPSRNMKINNYPTIEEYLVSGIWSNNIPEGFGKQKLLQEGKRFKIANTIYKSRKKTNNKWFEWQDTIAYIDEFQKNKIIFPAIMSNGPYFAYDRNKFLVLAPGNIITGNNLESIYEYLNTIGYFALRKFYMGGGINGELKVNRIKMLPIPKQITSISNKNDLYDILELTIEEVKCIENYMNEFKN